MKPSPLFATLTNNVNTNKLSSRKIIKEKKVFISRISPLILSRPSRSILAKLKFYKQNLLQNSKYKPQSKSYVQASKVLEVQEVTNKLGSKDKPRFNMTTKSPS